jgi:hypothetical protein
MHGRSWVMLMLFRVAPRDRPIRERPDEIWPLRGFHPMLPSAERRVVRTHHDLQRPVCLRGVPSPHENDRLSRPDRQTIRRASDNAKLEYYRGHRANFERRGEKPISAIGEMRGYPLSSLPSCQRPCGPPTGSWGHFFPTARLPKNVLERSISLEPALIVGWNALQLPVTGCPSPLE